jgi:hypothetical protein
LHQKNKNDPEPIQKLTKPQKDVKTIGLGFFNEDTRNNE